MQKVRSEVTRRIKNLGEQGKMKEAIQELANLAKVGVQPDTLAATTLVRACSRDMELAQSIFDELFGKSAGGIGMYHLLHVMSMFVAT